MLQLLEYASSTESCSTLEKVQDADANMDPDDLPDHL